MQTYPEYWQEKLPEGSKLRLYAIGGPCTARDLSDHDPSFVAYCGPDFETLEWIRSLFSTDYYIISLTKDVVGLECAVALKNGYAPVSYTHLGLKEHAGVPSELLEWHGHNDFYKAVNNSTTAWLYGASAVNSALFGIGERTGNTPLEAMVFEYAQLRGTLDGMDTTCLLYTS